MKIKKKDIITFIIIALVLAATVISCVFLAGRHRHTEYTPSSPQRFGDYSSINVSVNEVPRPTSDDIAEYINGEDNYIYYGNTENSILYFSCFLWESKKTLFFKYNTLNGNIAKIDFECDLRISTFQASDGYIYYFTEKNDSSTEKSLCRFPISGGNEQILTDCDTETMFIFASGNKVFLRTSKKISVYSTDKNKIQTLWDAEENGFYCIYGDIWYYGGNLYFLASSETPKSDIPTDERYSEVEVPMSYSYLISLNIKTKKSSVLLDMPINCFYMTENEIIYIPMVHAVTEIGGKLMPFFNDRICASDLDGSNPREIFSDLDVWAIVILEYNNGKIYVSDGYAETEKVSTWVIDINTGEVGIYRGEETE